MPGLIVNQVIRYNRQFCLRISIECTLVDIDSHIIMLGMSRSRVAPNSTVSECVYCSQLSGTAYSKRSHVFFIINARVSIAHVYSAKILNLNAGERCKQTSRERQMWCRRHEIFIFYKKPLKWFRGVINDDAVSYNITIMHTFHRLPSVYF